LKAPTRRVHRRRLAGGADQGRQPRYLRQHRTPKFAAQAIKKVAELAWHPVQFLTNVSVSVGGVMKPAGYENSQDILSAAYLKDPKDAQ